MNITHTRTTSPVFPAQDAPTSTRRQAFKQLGQALKSGDLDAARTAYASVVENAPNGAVRRPDSAFAQVGRALQSGDLGAATTAFRTVLQNGVGGDRQQPIRTTDAPILTTASAGPLGATLDLTA